MRRGIGIRWREGGREARWRLIRGVRQRPTRSRFSCRLALVHLICAPSPIVARVLLPSQERRRRLLPSPHRSPALIGRISRSLAWEPAVVVVRLLVLRSGERDETCWTVMVGGGRVGVVRRRGAEGVLLGLVFENNGFGLDGEGREVGFVNFEVSLRGVAFPEDAPNWKREEEREKKEERQLALAGSRGKDKIEEGQRDEQRL
jgi:hypothetical protein